MEKEILEIFVSNLHCFVCLESLTDSRKTSVRYFTDVSDKPIYRFIETFIGKKLEKTIFSSSNDASICNNCLEKIEKYDKICQKAAKIQDEITKSFSESQTKLHESKKEFLRCQTCFTQCSDYEDINSHQCFIDEEEFENAEDDSEDEPKQKGKQKAPAFNCYTCNVCQKQFPKKKLHQNHVKFAHLPKDAPIFNCEDCTDCLFTSEIELKLHQNIVHPADPTKPLQCPLCPKTFATKALLNRHFGIHSASENRPFICELCGKSFFHYSSFYAHTKGHNDERDFVCSMCSKAFRSISHLNRHLKTHTKQKDHECSECGSRFAERYNLTSHMKTHYGITRKRRPGPNISEISEIS